MKSNIKNLKITAEKGKYFRKRVTKEAFGEKFVIQLRDIVHSSYGNHLEMSRVIRTNDSSIKEADYLKSGDVLITVKGVNKHAIVLTHVPTKTVASQHFLLLRSPDKTKFLPEFIEFIVNSESSQRYFDRKCGGTYISTLNKEILENLPFPDIDIDKQKKIIRLAKEIMEEKKLMLDLIENRDLQLRTYSTKLIREGK
jgi:restriction endonuclease S subunit